MKKILFAAFAAATIGLAGYNVIESIQTAELSDLTLKNIEALADEEGNGLTDCVNGCLNKAGICFCYGFKPYEEKNWSN